MGWLPEYFQGKCHIVTQSSAIKLISSLFSLISDLHWTVLSCHCSYSQNKVLTTVTKGGSVWLSGVSDRGNGVTVTVFLHVPLVDVRKSTGPVEETQQASLLWLKSMRKWPRESLPTLTSGGESPEQLPTAIQHTKHMCPHAGGVLLPMRGWLAMAGFPWKTRFPWAQSLQKHDLYWQLCSAAAAQKLGALVVIWETNSQEEKMKEECLSSLHKVKEERNPNLLCPMTSCATELNLSQRVFQSLAFQRETAAPKNSRGGDNKMNKRK